jgi:hypothetical protein
MFTRHAPDDGEQPHRLAAHRRCYAYVTTLPCQRKPLHRDGERSHRARDARQAVRACNGEFEREATEYEEMLKALRRHLGVQQIAAIKH